MYTVYSWWHRRNANELGSIEPSLAASLESGGGDGQRVIHGALRFEGVADPTFPPELRKVTLALVDEFENLQVRAVCYVLGCHIFSVSM